MKLTCVVREESDLPITRDGPNGESIRVDDGCGAEVELDIDDRFTWDVTTDVQKGQEVVVERHIAPLCPACGVTVDHISEPVDPPEKFEVKA